MRRHFVTLAAFLMESDGEGDHPGCTSPGFRSGARKVGDTPDAPFRARGAAAPSKFFTSAERGS